MTSPSPDATPTPCQHPGCTRPGIDYRDAQAHRPLAWTATNRAVTVESVRRHIGGK